MADKTPPFSKLECEDCEEHKLLYECDKCCYQLCGVCVKRHKCGDPNDEEE